MENLLAGNPLPNNITIVNNFEDFMRDYEGHYVFRLLSHDKWSDIGLVFWGRGITKSWTNIMMSPSLNGMGVGGKRKPQR